MFALNRFGVASKSAKPAHRRNLPRFLTASMLVWLVAIGCRSEQVDPKTAELRQQFLVATEPAGAVTLTQLATQLGVIKPDEEATPDGEIAAAELTESVVIVGRIFAGDMEPWDTGKASFLIAELPDEGHGEGHDADNCPFCKRKAAKAPTAIVQFVDSDGQVIPIDARKLFGVDKKDVVVIRGQAAAGDLRAMVVTATDMHIRKK
ncbi:MAG TPA: hypothetical protein DDZ51_21200 [Planctomycetaceae bacterium]|nr:hypothetical protein [Planctomycetaceae bacterium]